MESRILEGDCIGKMRELEDGSVNCCVTSPPYFGLRSYFPDAVRLKEDAPEWVLKQLEKEGIVPLTRGHISE